MLLFISMLACILTRWFPGKIIDPSYSYLQHLTAQFISNLLSGRVPFLTSLAFLSPAWAVRFLWGSIFHKETLFKILSEFWHSNWRREKQAALRCKHMVFGQAHLLSAREKSTLRCGEENSHICETMEYIHTHIHTVYTHRVYTHTEYTHTRSVYTHSVHIHTHTQKIKWVAFLFLPSIH